MNELRKEKKTGTLKGTQIKTENRDGLMGHHSSISSVPANLVCLLELREDIKRIPKVGPIMGR